MQSSNAQEKTVHYSSFKTRQNSPHLSIQDSTVLIFEYQDRTHLSRSVADAPAAILEYSTADISMPAKAYPLALSITLISRIILSLSCAPHMPHTCTTHAQRMYSKHSTGTTHASYSPYPAPHMHKRGATQHSTGTAQTQHRDQMGSTKQGLPEHAAQNLPRERHRRAGLTPKP